MLNEFFKNENGQGMAEYALLIAFIALAVIGTVRILGQTVFTQYQEFNEKFSE